MVVQQYLQAWWNIEAEEAVNGIEALKMTEEKAYDLLLMDIRMPQMDGIEATRILRAERKKYRHTPVIALTADISALDLHKEDNKLFSAVVTKPFDPEVLRHSILALLNGNGNGNIPEMKEDQSEGEEMRFTQPEPDFSKAEEPFEGMPDRKQKFYDMALQSLAQYRKDFLHLMEQQDIPALEAIMHKQKLLFMMLGMGSFYQEMYQLRKEMESGVAFKDLAACLQDIDQGLETVINKINFRKAQLEQASHN
jgi:CheY-like chemotaxis protein